MPDAPGTTKRQMSFGLQVPQFTWSGGPPEIGQRLREAQRPPMLAILASEDPYVSAAEGVLVADEYGAEQLPLDGCGHWWMFEEPGLAADGLVAFWSGLD